MFSKPKKIGVGEPRNEVERQKVNKQLKEKHGIEEAFAKPKAKVPGGMTGGNKKQFAALSEDDQEAIHKAATGKK